MGNRNINAHTLGTPEQWINSALWYLTIRHSGFGAPTKRDILLNQMQSSKILVSAFKITIIDRGRIF